MIRLLLNGQKDMLRARMVCYYPLLLLLNVETQGGGDQGRELGG
jgi:hypothetical protein